MPLQRKTIGVLGQLGWIPDQMPHELPENAFSDVLDVRFFAGEARSMLGQRQVFNVPSITPYHLLMYTTATLRYCIHVGLTGAYADDGTTRTDITGTPFTGTADNKWTSGVINGFPVFSNGVDQPVYWDNNTANNLATLSGWDATERCQWIRTFKDFVFAGGITKSSTFYPNLLKWSDRAPVGGIPTSWDETDVTKLAGEQPLTGNDGLIVDALQMGDSLIVYFERGMVAVRENFDPVSVFTFQRLPGQDGLLAIGCVADTPAGHVVLTSGDVVIHQGQGCRSIAEGRIKEWLFTSMDATNRKRSFLVHNARYKEVWICFPTVGNSVPNMAAVYSYAYDNWTRRELPNVTCGSSGLIDFSASNTWDTQTETWDAATRSWDGSDFPPNEAVLLLGTTGPRIDIADVGGTMSGSAFYPYARRAGLAVDAPWRFKFFSGLTPRVQATVGTVVQISVGSQQVAERVESFGAVIQYTVGTLEPEACGISQSGRFLAYEIRSVSVQPWVVKSIDITYKLGGLH